MKHQITSIKAHGSELQVVNGMTFKSLTQADTVIFALIESFDYGFAKTKLDIEWSDGKQITIDCDYCENEGAIDYFNGQHKFFNKPYDQRYKFLYKSAENYLNIRRYWNQLFDEYEIN